MIKKEDTMPGFKHNLGWKSRGGSGRSSGFSGPRTILPGEHFGKPVPLGYYKNRSFANHGECKVVTPADPEKLAAYKKEQEEKRYKR